MKVILGWLLLFAAGFAWGRTDAPVEGFIQVEPGVSIYVNVTRGDSDAPVFVLLNGLTQDSDHWNTDVPYLQGKKATVVRMDLALQGRSMVKQLDQNFTMFNPVLPPLVVHGGLWDLAPTFPATSVSDQARFVSKALKALHIDKKVTLLGLSYGGGLALQVAADYPDQIESAILAAPYVFPLPDQDALIKKLVKYAKAFPQWAAVSDNDLYDLILRGLVVTSYPMIEPEIMKWRAPFQAIAVSELVRGIRHMTYTKLLNDKFRVPLHLVIAGEDQYIPRDQLEEFWSKVPTRVRGSVLEIQGSEHKMNEAVGPFLASWGWALASDPQFLNRPGRFLGVPEKGIAREIGGDRVIPLEKTENCQQLLAPSKPLPFQQIGQNPAAAFVAIISAANPIPGK